jgi:hypothetical protein
MGPICTVPLLAETGHKFLQAFSGIPAGMLRSGALYLVIFQIDERLDHEARAGAERDIVSLSRKCSKSIPRRRLFGRNLVLDDLDDVLEGQGIVLAQLLTRVCLRFSDKITLARVGTHFVAALAEVQRLSPQASRRGGS